jgi:protein SCO1/2
MLVVIAASAAPASLPSDSVYRLRVALVDQAGDAIGTDVFRGHPVLVTLFYAGCEYVCPGTLQSLRRLDAELPAITGGELRVLLISLDSARDTPERLKALALRQRLDLARFRLARASESDVRKLAGVFGVKYRKLPDGGFDHSTRVVLLDAEGQVVAHSDALGRRDTDFFAAVARASAEARARRAPGSD